MSPAVSPSTAWHEPSAMELLEVRDLAHRLGEPVPRAPVLVAERDGRIVAARSERTGLLVVDPNHGPPARSGPRR